MARPKGQFDKKKRALLTLLKQDQRQPVISSNADLAARLGVQERQVMRYLASLKREGDIAVNVHRFCINGNWCNHRFIQVKG